MTRMIETIAPRWEASRLGSGILAPVLAALVLVAGCATSAPSNEPDPVPTGPTVTVEPSTMPTPTSGVTIRWERASEPASRGGFIEAMVRGGDAWVGISDCRAGQCGAIGDGIVAWTSSDGETWSAHPFPRAAGARLVFRHLAVGAGGFLATTEDFSQPFPNSPKQLWASPDGQEWQVLGELDFVGCTRRTCPLPQSLALAPTGTVLVHARAESEEKSFGPFASDDGAEWRLVEPAAFGVDSLVVDSIQSTESAVLLMGRSCWDCEPQLWTSTDGVTWDRIEELTMQPYSWPSLATGDGRTVIALSICPAAPQCRSEVWSSSEGGSWTRGIAYPDVHRAAVTFTGSAFVAVGFDDFCRSSNCYSNSGRYVVLGSADGAAWTEIQNDSPMNPADGECPPRWVVGGAGTVLFGSSDCYSWWGTVELP